MNVPAFISNLRPNNKPKMFKVGPKFFPTLLTHSVRSLVLVFQTTRGGEHMSIYTIVPWQRQGLKVYWLCLPRQGFLCLDSLESMVA